MQQEPAVRAAAGSGGQWLPAQPPLFPAACGSALHRAAPLPHSELATLLTPLKTFCLLDDQVPFLFALD